MEILPSLISADILNLEKVIKSLDPYCNGYHVDVMDDHFVPNLTWGPMFVNAIKKVTSLPLHVHLMVDNPAAWIDRIQLNGKDFFIFHIEVFDSPDLIENLIQDVKSKGWKVGIALNPKTDIKLIFDYIKDLDHVLIMSVEPGFSGQKFIPEVTSKIEPLVKKREELNLSFKIGMDGGIGGENIKNLSEMGVDQFGIASAIFSKKDVVKALQELK
jgi:ribulose-phosphate 3-epimerase